MSSTFAIFKIAWQQMLVYRLNFVLWRFRTVLQFLLVYFTWWTIFQKQNEVFGYTQSSILTYILLISLVRAMILSSRANDVMNKINDGSIANFLLRPVSLIKFYYAQDMADKILNSFFMIIEISLIFFLLRPTLTFQTNLIFILLFIFSIVLGAMLWFYINFIIGLMAFWVENSWGPLFLLMIFMEGLGGGLFPIDILPRQIFDFLMITPFPYLIYFPAKVYVGGFSQSQLTIYFVFATGWVFAMYFFANWVLKKGLKYYSAQGG